MSRSARVQLARDLPEERVRMESLDPHAGIIEMVERHAADMPDEVVIVDQGQEWTRAELVEAARGRAAALLALGVEPGQLVAIRLPNGADFVAATLAIWMAQACPMTMGLGLASAESDALMNLARPSALIEEACTLKLEGRQLGGGYFSTWKVIASGGSTGQPKLIASTSGPTVSALAPHIECLRIGGSTVHLVTGPLQHNGQFTCAVAALVVGARLVIMPRFDPERALQLVEQHQVDWMYAVPTMLNRIWRLPSHLREGYNVHSLKTVLHLAAPCPEWLKRAWIEWLGPDRILEIYGTTEGQALTAISGEEWLAHPGSVGRAQIGNLRVVDEAGVPVLAGEEGLIEVRPQSRASYFYVGSTPPDPLTWETAGDRGRLDKNGYLYLLDRGIDMINVGGLNVYPAEVESAIGSHPLVRSSCVIGLPDEDLGSRIHAIVEADSGLTTQGLLEHVAKHIAKYKLPKTVEFVVGSLRDDSGKVRRSALRSDRLGGASRQ